MDGTMCMDKACVMYNSCYRAQAIPNEFRQAYFRDVLHKHEDGTCDYFCSILPTDRIVNRENE